MLRAEPNNASTILDYLNEDCWRVVLQYVPVRDLIRTERTSRLWQSWVLIYLKGVQISVVDENDRPKKNHSNACTLKLSEDAYESFAMWTRKLIDMQDYSGSEGLSPYNLNKDFKCLQGLHFYSCPVSDNFINQFVADKALEELEIRDDCYNVTGDFLNTINLSNLKYLALESLARFDTEHLHSAVNQHSELTKLVLVDMRFGTVEAIQYMVDKMKKLEYLELYDSNWMSCYEYEPIARLARLKFLRVSFVVPDEGVEAILEGCKELETLELFDCRGITSAHVADPFCRFGLRLHSLTLHKFHCMEDDDLVAIISSCLALTSLVVSAANLSPALPARAAAARSAVRPGVRLWLDLSDTILVEPEQLKELYGEYEPMRTDYEDLIIDLTVKD